MPLPRAGPPRHIENAEAGDTDRLAGQEALREWRLPRPSGIVALEGRAPVPRAAHGAALRHRLCHLKELASDLRVRYGVIEPDELDCLWSVQLLAPRLVLDAQLGTGRLQIGEEV